LKPPPPHKRCCGPAARFPQARLPSLGIILGPTCNTCESPKPFPWTERGLPVEAKHSFPGIISGLSWTFREAAMLGACLERHASGGPRCCYGIAPMWVTQLTDFEQVVKTIKRPSGPCYRPGLDSIDSARACAKEPQRRDDRREKSGGEGAETEHLAVTDFQVAENGLPPRPSRLCGLTGLPSTARIRLGSRSPARPQAWL